MTVLDYIILAILAAFIIKGLLKGLIRQLMVIVGMVVGLVLAWKFYPMLSPLAVRIGIPDTVSVIIAFIIIYAGVAISSNILGNLLHKTAKFLLLGWLNRLLGGFFGLFEGALLVMLAFFLINFTPFKKIVINQTPHAPIARIFKQLVESLSSQHIDIQEQVEKKLGV